MKKASSIISVSELKAVLLSVIRNVEKGRTYEVTKDNKKVAVIYPYGHAELPACGFSKGKICRKGAKLPKQPWSFDAHNLSALDED